MSVSKNITLKVIKKDFSLFLQNVLKEHLEKKLHCVEFCGDA